MDYKHICLFVNSWEFPNKDKYEKKNSMNSTIWQIINRKPIFKTFKLVFQIPTPKLPFRGVKRAVSLQELN